MIFCSGKRDDSNDKVGNRTFYDLASLTKPLVTVLSLLALREEKKIFWDDTIGSLLSLDVPQDKENIRLIHLMSHCSGLPAHRPYYKDLINIPPALRKKEIIRRILNEDLQHKNGWKTIYSDLGYILLGNIIEKKTGQGLDEYWQRKICVPLLLQNKLIFPKKRDIQKEEFASTGFSFMTTDKKLSGIVHDDNCRLLGGIAGHAGLFGTVDGVLSLCVHILKGFADMARHPSFSNDILREVLTRREKSPFTMGFDTPSPTASSSGHYFSKNSVGHLGFTGTSFWIDLQQKICIVFLTNRTFYGVDNEKLKKVRPAVHDLIMKGMKKG